MAVCESDSNARQSRAVEATSRFVFVADRREAAEVMTAGARRRIASAAKLAFCRQRQQRRSSLHHERFMFGTAGDSLIATKEFVAAPPSTRGPALAAQQTSPGYSTMGSRQSGVCRFCASGGLTRWLSEGGSSASSPTAPVQEAEPRPSTFESGSPSSPEVEGPNGRRRRKETATVRACLWCPSFDDATRSRTASMTV